MWLWMMMFHSLSGARSRSTFWFCRWIIECYRFFDVVTTRSLWLCSKNKGINSYLYSLAGVGPTCGGVFHCVNVSQECGPCNWLCVLTVWSPSSFRLPQVLEGGFRLVTGRSLFLGLPRWPMQSGFGNCDWFAWRPRMPQRHVYSSLLQLPWATPNK